MLDPQLGHLTWRHGTPLAWGTFAPHFGQTHWLGPPIACLPPPLPLPCPLWLIFPPRPETCCPIKTWLSFQDNHSFSSSSFFFAESIRYSKLSALRSSTSFTCSTVGIGLFGAGPHLGDLFYLSHTEGYIMDLYWHIYVNFNSFISLHWLGSLCVDDKVYIMCIWT